PTKNPTAPLDLLIATLNDESNPPWLAINQLLLAPDSLAKRDQLTEDDRSALFASTWSSTTQSLKATGDFEESRSLADNPYVGDLRRSTAALESIRQLAPTDGPQKTTAHLQQIGQGLRILQGGHNLQEIIDGLTALSAIERWELRSPQARTVAPRDWSWIATRIQMIPAELKSLDLKDPDSLKAITLASALLNETLSSEPFTTSAAEMLARKKLDRSPDSVRLEVDRVSSKVKTALALLRKPMEIARKSISKLTPKISELALALAKEETALRKISVEQSSTAATAKPEENRAKTLPQFTQQQQINSRIETLKDLIRADANEQNILKKDQRDRMRDADVLLALIKDSPPNAELALRSAIEASAAAEQKSHLDHATVEEQNVVDALTKIAAQYDALDQGKKVDLGLRNDEEKLGIKTELNEQFQKAEEIARLMEKSAADLLKELEGKLAHSPEMKRELDAITKATLATAKDTLDSAVKAQDDVAKKVATQTAKDNGPKPQLSASRHHRQHRRRSHRPSRRKIRRHRQTRRCRQRIPRRHPKGRAIHQPSPRRRRTLQRNRQPTPRTLQKGKPPTGRPKTSLRTSRPRER
ncbi:MAG: hypothetical protein NTX04_13980, partial [Verrucomicrobia bacterium]|nr:hypothetical protein [Verrucomicrobiota bacterium]